MQPDLLAPLAEAVERRGVVVRRPPRARALREHLQRLGADRLGAVDRGVDAAATTRGARRCASARARPRDAPPRPRPRGARRGGGARTASRSTLPFLSALQLPATTPSTRNVCVTSPFFAITVLRSSSGRTRRRSAWASSVLSHFGRKRTGAGVVGGRERGAREVEQLAAVLVAEAAQRLERVERGGEVRRRAGPTSRRCRRASPGRRRRGSGARARSARRARPSARGSGYGWKTPSGRPLQSADSGACSRCACRAHGVEDPAALELVGVPVLALEVARARPCA